MVSGPAGAILTVGKATTVTVTGLEVTEVSALSFTCRMKLQVPVAVRFEVTKL
jgi:hypothetical protein